MKETKGNIVTYALEDIMGERFGSYCKYIIQDRALPDARDGLKPVQRRILYSMGELGLSSDKPYKKSARIVGDVIGKYHPHGDTSVYDAMVRMSQGWKSLEPLIDMHGNNGSMDDDPPAAMRYTEARLASLAKYLLNDLDKDTVEFAPNFDDTEKEPTVLPARYPNLLVNGISGIAAGYATNIPPHNLSEVIDATIYRIQYPQCEVEDLMEYIQGPDFPTGGIVQGIEGIKDAFRSGKGRVVVRSKVEVVQTKTTPQIVISEIPYEVIKCNLVRKIDEIRLNKKIEGISDVRDESDRNGLRICLDLKKDANADLIINYLYKNTDLQVYYNYNVVAIVNKRPLQLGLREMLDAFIHHREEIITRRCRFDLERMEKRCHILEGLIKAVSVLDEIIALIRSSKDKADSKRRIIERFQFSDAQAEAIVTLRLYRLSSTDIHELQDEFSQLLSEMENLRDILNNEKILKSLMIKELKEVKKEFGSPRLTKIEENIQEIVIDKQQMIPNERVMVTCSRDGYIKRVSLRSYSASEHLLPGYKEGDYLFGYKEVSTLDYLLYITSLGNYGYVQVYNLPEAKWKDIGAHLNSIISMNSEEKIVSAFTFSTFDTAASILTLSCKGMIKKTALKDLEVSRNNKTMNLMTLKEGDVIVSAVAAYEEEDVILCSEQGYLSRYNVENIAATSPKGKGIIAMKSDCMADLTMVHEDMGYLLAVCENLQMKRLKLSDVNVTGRPVRGELIAKQVKSNPNLIKMIKAAALNDELHFITDEEKNVVCKDVALMSKEQTFSKPLFDGGTYLMRGIEEIKKVEPKLQLKEVSDDIEIEQFNLDF